MPYKLRLDVDERERLRYLQQLQVQQNKQFRLEAVLRRLWLAIAISEHLRVLQPVPRCPLPSLCLADLDFL